MDIDIDEDDDMTPIEEPVDTPPETPEVTESIMDNVDESVLGEDVIASSTDDPTLIIGTTVDTTENTGSDTDETIAGIDDDPMFNVETEETNTTDGQDTEENTVDTPAEPEATETPGPEIDETETEESGNTEDIQLPENGLTTFGYDIAPVLAKTDEETVKKFIAAENYMKERFVFDETNTDDMEAAAELKIGNDEEKDYKRNESEENISAVSKKILDAYYEFLMEDEHDKEFTDIVMDKINEMIDAGWITEDAAVGLYDNVTEGMQELKPLAAEDITEENTCETEIPEQEEVVSTEEE